MYERTRSPSSGHHGYTNATAKMANDIGPRKTMFVLVVVVGCFAILWPKVFYPMLVGSATQHMKPSPIDKTTGCCDVFSETDINTIKIMSELCSSIIQQSDEKPLSGKEIVAKCKTEVQQTCGIDISAVLQEQIRLGRSVKQILSEVRSLNGSLCLKYHYGVAPWRLGVPHRITINFTTNVRQERPPHLRSEIVHPAFRERGSAIPRPSGTSKKPPKIVEGRPGPIPGMRPTLGGAGHVVPPSQKTGSSMSVIMPIYTIGIVIFFTYTLMKLLFKKQPDGVGGSLYPPVEPDPRFRKEVFESERCKFTPRLSRDPTGRIVVNAMSALLNEVDEEFEARRKANAVANQAKSSSDHSLANGNLANGSVPKQHEQEQTSVKILGMETTASCEGGQKWNKSSEPVIPVPHPVEPKVPPQEIYLQGALPAQSQILVADSAVVTEPAPSDTTSDPAIVLAGKMTLSVISLDSTHETDKAVIETERPSFKAESADVLEINGDNENIDEDAIEESKYTTASSATVAENEISEEEGTDNDEDIEKINELELEINHIAEINGFEVQERIEDEVQEEIQESITKEAELELQEEVEKALHEDIKDVSQEEIHQENVQEDAKENVEQEDQEALNEAIQIEIEEIIKESVKDVEESVLKDVKDTVPEKLKEEIQNEIAEIKEVQEEVKESVLKEVETVQEKNKEEIQNEIAEINRRVQEESVKEEIKEVQEEVKESVLKEVEIVQEKNKEETQNEIGKIEERAAESVKEDIQEIQEHVRESVLNEEKNKEEIQNEFAEIKKHIAEEIKEDTQEVKESTQEAIKEAIQEEIKGPLQEVESEEVVTEVAQEHEIEGTGQEVESVVLKDAESPVQKGIVKTIKEELQEAVKEVENEKPIEKEINEVTGEVEEKVEEEIEEAVQEVEEKLPEVVSEANIEEAIEAEADVATKDVRKAVQEEIGRAIQEDVKEVVEKEIKCAAHVIEEEGKGKENEQRESKIEEGKVEDNEQVVVVEEEEEEEIEFEDDDEVEEIEIEVEEDEDEEEVEINEQKREE